MPDPLQEELVRRAQAAIQRKLMPPQAGEASPGAMQAAAAMRKAYPADMVNVQVKDMDWNEPDAFSNILAYTPTKMPDRLLKIKPDLQEGDPESISVNPGSSIIEPQSSLNSILAHELQHVRQNRNGDLMARLLQQHMAYAKRPDELEAQAAAKTYEQGHPNNADYPRGSGMVLQELSKFFRP